MSSFLFNGTNNVPVASSQASINNLNVAQQVLIVEIDTVNGTVSRRIVY